MEREELEKIIRDAFRAGEVRGAFDAHNNYFDSPLDENEYVEDFFNKDKINEEDEKYTKITLGMIKATCGWSKFCDVTGGNHYMLNEWTVDDDELFEVKYKHLKELGLK